MRESILEVSQLMKRQVDKLLKIKGSVITQDIHLRRHSIDHSPNNDPTWKLWI